MVCEEEKVFKADKGEELLQNNIYQFVNKSNISTGLLISTGSKEHCKEIIKILSSSNKKAKNSDDCLEVL